MPVFLLEKNLTIFSNQALQGLYLCGSQNSRRPQSMIKIFFSFTTLLTLMQVKAQTYDYSNDQAHLNSTFDSGINMSGVPKGNCFFYEDFEGGSIPSGWEVGAQVEQLDPNNIGLGTFVDPWVVGNSIDANNNGFLPIPDDPVGNLFAFAGDDGSPCNCDMDSVRLSTPDLDLTGSSNLAVSLLAYSDAEFNGGDLEISASTDQGNSWQILATVPPLIDAWQEVFVSLSSYDGVNSLMLGFQWTDNSYWASGVAIDNVCISEVLQFNLALKEPFMADVSGSPDDASIQSFQYSFLALDQSISTIFGAYVKNVGSSDMTNVVVDCEIFQNSISQGSFNSPIVPLIEPGEGDTILWDTGWMPAGSGDFEYSLSVSADSADQFLGNNSLSISQLVSDDVSGQILGRDNDVAESFVSNNGSAFEYGPHFKISHDGQVYGLLVAIGEGEGANIRGHIYDSTLDDIAQTDTVTLGSGDENIIGGNTMVYLPFPMPIDVSAQSIYIATVEHFGGPENVSLGVSGKAQEQTTHFIDEFGAIFIDGTVHPMVRLVMATNSLIIEDLQPQTVVLLGNNVPNPFSSISHIPYELIERTHVTFNVTDMKGKLIIEQNEGTKRSGSYIVDVDGSKLANGMYIYSIITHNSSVHRRMIISH